MMNETIEITKQEKMGDPRRLKIVALGALVLIVLGGASMVAASHFGGPMLRHRGPMDPETAKEHIEFVSGFVLSKVDASDEQQAEIKDLLEATVDDLAFVAAEHRAGREAFHGLLMQETVDRAMLEETRLVQMALADQASRRIVETLADVAEVLTVEQRGELVELAERHHGR